MALPVSKIMKFSLIFAALSGISQAAKWSYTGESGPLYWHQVFPHACSGKHQSPIDIRPEETIYNANLKDFAIWYDPPKQDSKMYIRNNGHTVQVDLEGDFYVANGGLSNVYKALQFHFHWGHKSHHGSEHLFDGKPSPIELHIVTYNQELFSQIDQALQEKGGLAVLGVMYEMSEEDNPSLEQIITAIKHVRDPEKHERVDIPLISLRDLLPEDITKYYRYNGSLTTPGCFESVIWTVFDEKQTISPAQLNEFTTLLQFKHKHGKSKKGDGSRHRRSLTKAQREMERRAENVLEELGIKGNEFEEAVLKSELIQKQMMADMPQPDAALKEMKPTMHSVMDEKGSTRSDRTTDHNVHDNPHHRAGSHHPHHEEKVFEIDEDMYIQELMVNNFRPVQPLNDRTVYRSFKLRDIETSDDNVHIGRSHSHKSTGHEDHGHSSAAYDRLPVITVILAVTIHSLFFM